MVVAEEEQTRAGPGLRRRNAAVHLLIVEAAIARGQRLPLRERRLLDFGEHGQECFSHQRSIGAFVCSYRCRALVKLFSMSADKKANARTRLSPRALTFFSIALCRSEGALGATGATGRRVRRASHGVRQ